MLKIRAVLGEKELVKLYSAFEKAASKEMARRARTAQCRAQYQSVPRQRANLLGVPEPSTLGCWLHCR